MRSTFDFDSRESFHEQQSTELARLLLDASATVRRKVRRSFGITVELDADPVRVSHDGQRIGIGAFNSLGRQVQFTIGPKVAMSVHELVRALHGTDYFGHLAAFEAKGDRSDIQQRDDELAPAFLVSLHRDIADYAARHVDVTHHRRKEFVGWRLRGRPVTGDIVRRLCAGRFDGVVCEVYDDRAFEDYADVLVGTASSIRDTLKSWGDIIEPINADLDAATRLIFGKLGHLTGAGFSVAKLLRICRPPFPLGLRGLLYSCLRYWKWRGSLGLAKGDAAAGGFWQLSLRLDQLFERYVGVKWSSSLSGGFQWSPSPAFQYEVRNEDSGESQVQEIIPDHLFVAHDRKLLLVVDAKYRTDIGARDQVYQMASYLAYEYGSEFDCDSRIGVLVYPGETWKAFSVSPFHPRIFAVQMPVSSSEDSNNASIVVEQLIQASGKSGNGKPEEALDR